MDARDQGFSQAMTGRLGPVTKREFDRFGYKSPLNGALMFDLGMKFAPLRDGPVFPAKAPIPDDLAVMSAHIKALGYYLKAQGVGICELPQWSLYSIDQQGKPIDLKHKYAILLLSEWDYETMHGSTGHDWISNCESFLTYNASAHMAISMAAYIRRLGFPARAHFQSGPIPAYDMVLTPLLILSGMGELSRAGWALILTWVGDLRPPWLPRTCPSRWINPLISDSSSSAVPARSAQKPAHPRPSRWKMTRWSITAT